MKILVAFKTVKEYDNVLDSDWEVNGNQVNINYAKEIINLFDEGGLELAMQLAEGCPGTTITAVTVADEPNLGLIRNMAAVGITDIHHLKPDNSVSWCPKTVAKILSDFFVHNGGYDIVIMGNQAGDEDFAVVPLYFAEMQNLPVVTSVINAIWEQSALKLVHQCDLGNEHITFNKPAVITIGNAEHPYLRFPTLREKLGVKSFSPAESSVVTNGLHSEELSFFTTICREEIQGDCTMLLAATPADAANQILEKAGVV